MKIQVLGAHNCESQSSKLVSLLVDDILALDAGAITSSLSFPAQQKLKAILLSHQHYDHVRDVLSLGFNLLLQGRTINIYAIAAVREVLTAHLLNGEVYAKLLELPPDNPTVKFTII